MFKSEEENLQRELLALREENKNLKNKITQLELLVSEQKEILAAQENVSELARSERLFAEATIKAYEKVIELSSTELDGCMRIMDAQEKLQDYTREKRIFLDGTIEAFNRVLDLSRKELEDAYNTIGAYENVSELARTEISNLLEKINSLSSQRNTKSSK
ncbi:MAG: hypothetical protein OEV44_08520 [Spirochaetota bacterium]|nr:hypothetical protein [Spirochaetota bacterium]